MGREALIRIQGARLGSHPEALALNASFRRDTPILKLAVEVEWKPKEPAAALAALEARLVEFCPSLRDHQCRGEESYRILRSTGDGGRTAPDDSTAQQAEPIEAALALAHLFEHVMIDTIAFITDAPIISGATAALKGSRKRFDIFVERLEPVRSFERGEIGFPYRHSPS